jgi:hypothetical protein
MYLEATVSVSVSVSVDFLWRQFILVVQILHIPVQHADIVAYKHIPRGIIQVAHSVNPEREPHKR